MYKDTSMNSPNSHLVMLQSTSTANDIYAFEKADNNSCCSIVSIYDNLQYLNFITELKSN